MDPFSHIERRHERVVPVEHLTVHTRCLTSARWGRAHAVEQMSHLPGPIEEKLRPLSRRDDHVSPSGDLNVCTIRRCGVGVPRKAVLAEAVRRHRGVAAGVLRLRRVDVVQQTALVQSERYSTQRARVSVVRGALCREKQTRM